MEQFIYAQLDFNALKAQSYLYRVIQAIILLSEVHFAKYVLRVICAQTLYCKSVQQAHFVSVG